MLACSRLRCGGVRVSTVYVPNGRSVDTEFYERKLVWFGVLRDWLARPAHPMIPLIILGDFNVAPEDRDVWDPQGVRRLDARHRARARGSDGALRLGPRGCVPPRLSRRDRLYTYWDYRAGDFHQHRGMRIDLALATRPVAERVTWALVDRNARKGSGPSDHAPLIVDLREVQI